MCPLDEESAARFAALELDHEALNLGRFHVDGLKRLRSLIRSRSIDVVHWNFFEPFLNPYLWSLSILNPCVQHYFTDHISRHVNADAPTRERRSRSIIKRAVAYRYVRILCVSDYVLSHVKRIVGERAERIHSFVNADRFRPDPGVRREVRLSLGVPDDVFVTVTAAYLIKDKGIDVALKAMAELPAGTRLWVVGDGPERRHLEALAISLGLSDRVQFLGRLRYVEPVFQAADCFVCPSLWAEAAGLVNLEALACGLPVVASRIGGIPELIDDGRTGLLFSPGDHKELAAGLRLLKGDVPTRLRMGQEARSIALERFSGQSVLDGHMNHYRAGLSGSPPAAGRR
jgi:glycosyltransferase involved in cell wall biosynthesis